jgi:mono/diheme cytochrome c family protein
MIRKFVFSLALIAIGFMAVSLAPAAADEAAQNYQTFCAKCHGPNGHGDGPGAATLTVKPRNFADCDRMRKVSDTEAYNVIRNGGAANNLSADMPAWKDGFDEGETRELVQFVRTFCPDNGAGITKVRQR